MNNETAAVKPLTKEETKALLSFIERSHIITSKTTNATTNKLKNEEWKRISDQFNATVTTCRRTPQQLRLKWENLKKNSRKRNTLIRMNNIKTGGGGPDYIPPDDILDRVAALLGSTVDGFTVRFGGDAELEKCPDNTGFGKDNVPPSQGDGSSVGVGDHDLRVDFLGLPPTDEVEVLDELVETASTNTYSTPKLQKFSLSTPRASGFKRKHVKSDENRAVRNLAIAEYFTTKKKVLEARVENILLENEKLKLEIEKLEKID